MKVSTDIFPKEYIPIVCDDYIIEIVTSVGRVGLHLWDTTAGCFESGLVRPLTYPGTDVFLVCYSVSDIRSFGHVKTIWLPEIRQYRAPVVLVACKTDERDLAEQGGGAKFISTKQGKNLAKEIGARAFLECSARTGVGVQRVIDTAAKVAVTHALGIKKVTSSCVMC